LLADEDAMRRRSFDRFIVPIVAGMTLAGSAAVSPSEVSI
jgi:hypothetical protein